MASTTFQFYGGEDKTLSVRLKKTDSDGVLQAYEIPAGSTVTFVIPASPAELELAGTIDNYDRGEIHIDLSDTQTESMISGDLIVKIQSGSITRIAKLVNAIKKLTL